jgi:hypothetical protein
LLDLKSFQDQTVDIDQRKSSPGLNLISSGTFVTGPGAGIMENSLEHQRESHDSDFTIPDASDLNLKKSSKNLTIDGSTNTLSSVATSINGFNKNTRKSTNSWLAQSFRKAFSKIDHKRAGSTKNPNLNKSQYDLNYNHNNQNSNFRAMSTLSINNNSNNNRLEQSSNDAEGKKKEDNREEVVNKDREHEENAAANDSDSDYEQEKQTRVTRLGKNSRLAQTKRSFRSESELVRTTRQVLQQQYFNNNTKIDENMIEIEIKQPQKLQENLASKNFNTNLIKSHKSVCSLLTPNQSQLTFMSKPTKW